MSSKASGIEPGQRQLNGTQTTGRRYRNLSTPDYRMTRDDDVEVLMRDGINLLADVYRPDVEGKFPVLIAASPYPRQIQNLGAPMGFIEAGASDFWVPRGYVHVIANCRGTSGSGGTFGLFDAQERRDMHDLVEWSAAQPWSDGNVGMLGISYFAMTQLEAAVEQPPHLKAIFPLETTVDLYESANHNGLMSSSFVTAFLAMVGMTSGHTNRLWRSRLLNGIGDLLRTPRIHGTFATANGEAAMAGAQGATQAAPRPTSVGRPGARHRRQTSCSRRVVGGTKSDATARPGLGTGLRRLRLGQRTTASARQSGGHQRDAQQSARPDRDAGRPRHQLAVGEPARRGPGLVRPLAQGSGYRHPRWSVVPVPAARGRGGRVEDGRGLAGARCRALRTGPSGRRDPGHR